MQHGIPGLLATLLPIVVVVLTALAVLFSVGTVRMIAATLLPASGALLAWLFMETAFEAGHMLAVVIYLVFFLLLGVWYTGLFGWLAYRSMRGEEK